MSRYSLEHLSDQTLLRDLATLVARDRVTTADLLAHIAEVDARGLYRDQSCPSMFAYCVERLRLSEDAAYKRIQAARAARRFPLIFHALADGRLHLTGVGLLAAHLTEENAAGLLAAARDKSKAQIEQLLAARFPRPGLLSWVASLPGAPGDGMAGPLAPAQVGMTKAGHAAAASRPRRTLSRPTRSARHVPAHVKRAVWDRDQGRCTFVSETGTRCSARIRLEFDHMEEVARGGEATVPGIRLLCRAHNQYLAERAFGAEFMRRKRLAAAEARDAARNGHARAGRRADTHPHAAAAAARAVELDVVPWLRALGFSAAQARHAAGRCGEMPEATLEERVKAALSHLRPRGTRTVRPGEGHPPPLRVAVVPGALSMR